MKYSKLDCGMSVAVTGSKKIGLGPLVALLSRLVRKSNSFPVTFLFKGFGVGIASFGGSSSDGWSS